MKVISGVFSAIAASLITNAFWLSDIHNRIACLTFGSMATIVAILAIAYNWEL